MAKSMVKNIFVKEIKERALFYLKELLYVQAAFVLIYTAIFFGFACKIAKNVLNFYIQPNFDNSVLLKT